MPRQDKQPAEHRVAPPESKGRVSGKSVAKKSLIRTNKYLADPVERNRMLTASVETSSAIEGATVRLNSAEAAPVSKQAKAKSVYAKKANGRYATGRPSTYNPDKHPDAAYSLCARLGAEDTDLAKSFLTTVDCITKWKVEYPEFLLAIKSGKAAWDDQNVVSALRRRALGYEYDEREEGFSIKSGAYEKTMHKKLAPDVTACIFWLVNRQPDEWKHVARTIVQGDAKNPVQHEYKFDLSQLPEKELDNLESIITKARAAKQGSPDNGTGPHGTA